MGLFVFVGLIGLISFLIYYFLVINLNYWKKRGVDGPKPKPLVGNVTGILTQSRNMIYDIQDIYREYKNKERFAGFFMMRSPQLLIVDPKLSQEILITNFKSFHDNEFGRSLDTKRDPILAQNPFFLTGSAWKEKRAEITPALTTNRIKASYPVMLEVCKKMTKYLNERSENPSEGGVDAKQLAAKFTSEVVANCIYGIEGGAFSGESEIIKMGSTIFDNSFAIVLYSMVLAAFPSFVNIYKMQMVKDDVAQFFTNLMEKAIELRKETKSDRVDFLNYLLQLREKKNLSNLEMAAHTMTFFLDGFETSSVVIANCMHLLGQNQDVQQKLRKEITAAYNENDGIAYEKLLELPYLDQCINETLRLRPPATFSGKLCTEPCEIRTMKDKVLKVEKDMAILLPYYCFQNDPEYFSEPEKFCPERFDPELGGVAKYKEMGVFVPFGDGPRICLGMRFGVCQSKAAIAEIIRNFEVTVNPKTKAEFVIDPKQFLCLPEGGIWLDFNRVQKR